MTLTDPKAALADASTFIDYLLGLRGLGQTVRRLADDPRRTDSGGDRDFVYALLGIAGIAEAIEDLATPATGQPPSEDAHEWPDRGWLR